MAAKAAHMRAVAKEKPKSMEAKEKKHVVFALEQDPVKRKEAAKICKRKIMAQMKKLLEKCNETCFYVGVLDNVPANVSNLSVLGPESVAELGSQLAVELSRFKVRLGDSYLPSSVETHDFDALSVDSLRALLKHVPPKLQKGTRHIWWIASSVPDGATNSRLSKEDSVTLCKAYVQHLICGAGTPWASGRSPALVTDLVNRLIQIINTNHSVSCGVVERPVNLFITLQFLFII